MQNRLDEILNGAVNRGDIPGVAATVATSDEVLYENACGRRGLDTDADMHANSVFWIASMTKAITTAAVMQLVERGKADLHAPASEYLPALGEVAVLAGFDGNDQPQTRAPETPVTLHQLITHTSGFSYEIWNADAIKYQQVAGVPAILSAQKSALQMPLVFDPGTAWEYGIGLALAGQVVEAISGESLGEYFQKNLFDPLGMQDTGFKLNPTMRERQVSMSARGEGGALSPFSFETPQEPEVQLGGEALYSTPQDYQRFLRMFLGGGELDGARVLSAKTIGQMSQNQIGDLALTPMQTSAPHLANDTDFFPGMQQKWSYGFLINTEQSPEGRSAGSLSWAGLSNCYYWIDPTKNLAGALYSQVLPFFDPKVVALFREFETAVYAEL